jgi:hypothetical protein
MSMRHASSPFYVGLYLTVVGEAVRRMFSPTDNRRISAVVLTAGAIYDLAPATNQVRSVTFPEVVVPNPHAINPVIWLPGEGEWFVAVR